MYSKFAGECRACGESFPKGEPINWSKAGGAVHTVCPKNRVENQTYPCWTCKEPGRMRNYGAATPVYCDGCDRAHRESRTMVGNVVINATFVQGDGVRLSSQPGDLAEINPDAYLSHEDAPCCGCCS